MDILRKAREAFAKAKRERNDVPTESQTREKSEESEKSPPTEGERDAAGWTFVRGASRRPGWETLQTPFDEEP